MKTFSVTKNIKLSRFLFDSYNGGLSYTAFCRLLRKKDIKVNGKRVSSDVSLNCGDEVVVYFDGEEKRYFTEVFKDDNVLIVDKFKGVTSEELYEKLKSVYGEVYFCHRLDRNTDGLMAFALNVDAYDSIRSGLKSRRFDKIYRALVFGTFENDAGIERAYLKKDAQNSLVKVTADKKGDDSLEIVTEYRVISTQDGNSELAIKLHTGRTHQIRAHLAYLGHFVLGDGKYGEEKINRRLGFNMMQLSSAVLKLNFSSGDKLFYLDGKKFVKSGFEYVCDFFD